MRGVDAAPSVSASRPSCRAFQLQVRARVSGLERTPSALDWGVALLVPTPPRLREPTHCSPRCRLCEPAFEPCSTGESWGSSARCRPGQRNPARKPNRHRHHRRRDAAPERERAVRLGRGERRLTWGRWAPTRGWAAPAHEGPLGAQLAETFPVSSRVDQWTFATRPTGPSPLA
jgi:hypothetical protein